MEEIVDKNLIVKPAIIYKVTNQINGKEYVGQFSNSCRTFDGYWGSGKAVKMAIKKYGQESFKKEIIVKGDFNQNLINELEKHYIQLYNTITPFGYNLNIGGDATGRLLKRINQYDLEGNLIKVWKSIREIRKNNFTNTVLFCTRGCRLTYKNNIWLYDGDSIQERISLLNQSKELIKIATKNRKRPVSVNKKSTIVNILQYTKEGIFVKKWNNCKEIVNTLHINGDSIYRCLAGKRDITYKNFIWVTNSNDVLTIVERLNKRYDNNRRTNI